MAVSFLLFSRFKKALISSFDEQLQARAFLVAEKTSVQPRIVPLPQGDESFVILYSANHATDTLFEPHAITFVFPSGNDSIAANSGWRSIRVRHSIENGGSIEVIYALPSDVIDKKVHELALLIWIVLPIGCLLSAIIAYRLSSKLIKPVMQVIDLANSINLNNNTVFLKEHETEDELKELIVSFNRMLKRIKEQSDRQTAFFASASHELRTPLSIMQTRLQVLMQNETSPIKELYSEQLKEVKQLTQMVNDFLLLSELRSGLITFSKSETNLSDIISELITKYKSKAITKGLQFKISYQPVDESYDLFADAEKLNIIIGNLLDNAIKYSPEETAIEICIQKNLSMQQAEDTTFAIVIKNKIRKDINPQVSDLKNVFYHSKPLHGEGYGLSLWIANQLAGMQEMELYCSIEDRKIFEATLVI